MRNLLKAFGADDKESNVFIKLLEIGAQPVSVIAKYTGVPRPSMYVIIERLKKLQLVEEFTKNRIKYVKSISADEMKALLLSKERDLKRVTNLFAKQEQALLALENKLSTTPIVRFYQGKKELMKMYETMLHEGGFCAIFNPGLVKKMMPEYHYRIGQNLNKNHWQVKEMAIVCPEAVEYKELFETKGHQIKILPKEMQFKTDIILFKEKMYLVSYGEADLTGTEIVSASLVEAEQALFDNLWEITK
ncbi:MAG: helix-turn-helix domain-containing protein [Candidatus Gracilibacteria bacterium]